MAPHLVRMSDVRTRSARPDVPEHDKDGRWWTVIRQEGEGETVGGGKPRFEVWDITLLRDGGHPGGRRAVEHIAGKDGTRAIARAGHSSDIAKRVLSDSSFVGVLDPRDPVDPARGDVAADQLPRLQKRIAGEVQDSQGAPAIPPLGQMLNHFDFEHVARTVLPQDAWSYYSSGADDEITLRENRAAFQRVWMRPRVLVDVDSVSMQRAFAGMTSLASLPLYLTATAMGKLAHPEGEKEIMRGAHLAGVPYMMPTLSSCTLKEMLAARNRDSVSGEVNQPTFSQLYVSRDRNATASYIQTIVENGVRALFVTVDAAQLGQREKDMRNKFEREGTEVQAAQHKRLGGSFHGKKSADPSASDDDSATVGGITRSLSTFIDPSLSWKDIEWMKSVCPSDMKIYLKGVQCGADAKMALQHGLAGIVLSNHGGRQIDTSRSGLEILPECMEALRSCRDSRMDSFEVFIDGGVRRGSDIFKALALGATAVGIGRPYLYALATHGAPGIAHLVGLLRDELAMTMRLMGAPTLRDISQDMVSYKSLADHVGNPPRDFLADRSYEQIPFVSKL